MELSWEHALLLVLISVIISYTADYVSKDYEIFKAAYITIMQELDQHYLCCYSIYEMIRTRFFQRFGKLNEEGFCYTVSAAIALSLKDFHHTRIVRGHIVQKDFESYHSWVEVFFLWRWWVIDPCWMSGGFIDRRAYYNAHKPKILVTYRYSQIWGDPAATQYYERMTQPKTSKIFCNLYYHYTPDGKNIQIRDLNCLDEHLPEYKEYYLFPTYYSFKFNQRIVNELMARPTRKSPRRRTLRRLEMFYRQQDRIRQNQTPA